MKALIGGTPIGKPLEDAHIQIYGWIDVGGNVSSATHGFGGNAPVADAFTQNTVQLDQAVVYIERYGGSRRACRPPAAPSQVVSMQ
jgi:hypothetical protein